MKSVVDVLVVIILVLFALLIGSKLLDARSQWAMGFQSRQPMMPAPALQPPPQADIGPKLDQIEKAIRETNNKTNSRIDDLQKQVDALKDSKNPHTDAQKSLDALSSKVDSLTKEVSATCESKPPVIVYKTVKVPVEKKKELPPPPSRPPEPKKELPPPPPPEPQVVIQKVFVPVIPCEASAEYIACVKTKEKQWEEKCPKRGKDDVKTEVSRKSERVNSQTTIEESVVDYTVTAQAEVNTCSYTRDQVKDMCLNLICKKDVSK